MLFAPKVIPGVWQETLPGANPRSKITDHFVKHIGAHLLRMMMMMVLEMTVMQARMGMMMPRRG